MKQLQMIFMTGMELKNDVPKSIHSTSPNPPFCEPRLCLHVSDGSNQISITDISVNTFSSFTQPGSTNTDISNNWASTVQYG